VRDGGINGVRDGASDEGSDCVRVGARGCLRVARHPQRQQGPQAGGFAVSPDRWVLLA
jgi:hypothetical protein